jgi:hypothetical protein
MKQYRVGIQFFESFISCERRTANLSTTSLPPEIMDLKSYTRRLCASAG